MAEPVEVVIMGQMFSVTSEDGEEHVRRVAGYVDGKMREMTPAGRSCRPSRPRCSQH